MLEHIWQRVATKSYLHHPTTRWATKRLHPTFNSLSKPGQNQHCKRLFQLKTWICLAPSQVISISVFLKILCQKKIFFFRFYRPIKVPHLSLKKKLSNFFFIQYDKTASLPVNGFTRLGWEVAWILKQARTRHVEIGSSSHSKHDRSNVLSN